MLVKNYFGHIRTWKQEIPCNLWNRRGKAPQVMESHEIRTWSWIVIYGINKVGISQLLPKFVFYRGDWSTTVRFVDTFSTSLFSTTSKQILTKLDRKQSSTSSTNCNTVNVDIFTWGLFFAIVSSSRKFLPRENKTHISLLRKYENYRENYPHVKGLGNIFRIIPQRK